MSASQHFRYGSLTIRVETSDAADLIWLHEFLTPWFAATGEGDADCRVRLVDDPTRYQEILGSGPRPDGGRVGCFALDQGAVRFPWWTPEGSAEVVFDDEHRLFYLVSGDRSEVRILAESNDRARRTALMRVVREYAMTHAWTPTRGVIHGAALARGEDGIVIAGPKGAGKTSLLIHTLRGAGVRFVSNDRVVVETAASPPVVHGMPTIITLRDPAAALFPELAGRLTAAKYHESTTRDEAAARGAGEGRSEWRSPMSLSPAQFCAALDVGVQPRCRLRALLFPRVDVAADGIEMQRLTPAAAAQRLRGAVFAVTSPYKTSEVFCLPSQPSPDAEPATLERLCARLAAAIPSFACRLGPRAYAQPDGVAELLDRVLAWQSNAAGVAPAPLSPPSAE